MTEGEAGIRVVVGLGNPGRRYVGTRHNVGFEVLDRLAGEAGSVFARESRWEAEVARLTGSGVVLVKPQTFMNLSGKAVAAITRFYRLVPENVLVVHDDVDLPLGQLRLREKGSAGGHNGIRSVIGALGSDRFGRLKIGVDGVEIPRDLRMDMAEYVLGKFDSREEPEVQNCLDRAVDAVKYALAHGVAAAMNAFNRKPPPSSSGRRPDGSGAISQNSDQ